MGAIVHRAIVWGAIVHRAIVLGEGLLYRGYCPRTGNKRRLWHFDGFDSASEGHSSHLPQAHKGQNFWHKAPNLLQNATRPHQHTEISDFFTSNRSNMKLKNVADLP